MGYKREDWYYKNTGIPKVKSNADYEHLSEIEKTIHELIDLAEYTIEENKLLETLKDLEIGIHAARKEWDIKRLNIMKDANK